MAPVEIWKAYAYGTFRWGLFFVIAVILANESQKFGATGFFLLMALDAGTQGIGYVNAMSANALYGRVWHNTLTDRIFFQEMYLQLKDRQNIDPELLFKESSKRAISDIVKSQADEGLDLGSWAKFGIAVWTFFWHLLRFALFYGAAAALGGLRDH